MIHAGFDTRFTAYTVLAVCCCCFNILSLAAMANIKGHRTVYHTLLVNLACCDICGSILLWMYYNSPSIFPLFEIKTLLDCMFKLMVLVAPFILSLCSSSLALLLLAVNQYIAICQPFFSTTKVTKKRISICICLAWSISLTLALVPAITMMIKTKFDQCAEYTKHVGQKAIEVCSYFLAILVIFIICLYARIYREVVAYRKRTPKPSNSYYERTTSRSSLANGRHIRRQETDAEKNYKAFITTLLLSGTLVFFWLPFLAIHFITAHMTQEQLENIPLILLNFKFYLFDFMPIFNFLTDPIIYGVRMREIRDGYRRLFHKIMPCIVKEPRRANFRDSVRFSTLDSSI